MAFRVKDGRGKRMREQERAKAEPASGWILKVPTKIRLQPHGTSRGMGRRGNPRLGDHRYRHHHQRV